MSDGIGTHHIKALYEAASSVAKDDLVGRAEMRTRAKILFRQLAKELRQAGMNSAAATTLGNTLEQRFLQDNRNLSA